VVNIYARITTLSRRPVNWFEEAVTVDIPTELLQQAVKGSSIYQKSIPLQPGRYRLNVVAKDVVGGNTTNYEQALDVPRMDEDQLGTSSLILADLIEKVPSKSIGAGQFVIGTSKVRPRVSESFRRDEKMGIYVQLYNFQTDEKNKKPDGTVQYQIFKTGQTAPVFDFSEDVSAISPNSSQVVVEKLLSLQDLEPGQYTLKVTVQDKRRNQTVTPSAAFSVM
jgi:hypothetical protein